MPLSIPHSSGVTGLKILWFDTAVYRFSCTIAQCSWFIKGRHRLFSQGSFARLLGCAQAWARTQNMRSVIESTFHKTNAHGAPVFTSCARQELQQHTQVNESMPLFWTTGFSSLLGSIFNDRQLICRNSPA